MNEMKPVLEQPGRALSYLQTDQAAGGFSRHRYELPLLSALLGFAVVELLAVHLLLSLWSATAAWVLTALSLLAMVQIAWLIRGMVRHPHQIDTQNVHVRYDAAGKLLLPLASILRAENVAFAPEQKGSEVFRATLIASPNLALHLAEPVTIRRRQVSLVTVRLDDPAAFLARLATAQAGLCPSSRL